MAFDENGNRPFAEADAATHPALLNVLVVGATAHARKSTAHLQIRRLMAKANPEFFEAHVQNGFNSGEALLDTVQEAPHHSLLAVEQEFGRVLVVAQREGSILSLIIRQAWDGDPLRVRSRQKSVNVPTRGCPVRRGICSGGPPPDPCQLVGIGRSAKNIRDRGPPP
jgi:hypothetical protein